MSKKSKYSTLTKNTVMFTISNFGSKIISFLMIPLYTYILSTADYGAIDLVTSAAALLVPLLTLNIQDAVLRFSLDTSAKPEDVISVGMQINALGSIVLGIVSFVLCKTRIITVGTNYLFFLFFSYLGNGLYNSFSMYLKARDRVNILMIGGISNTLISCILNICLLVIIRLGVNGYLIANVLGTFFANSLMFYMGGIYKEIRFFPNSKLRREMIWYSLPLVFNSIAWWINNASDKYILTFFCGITVNGIFSVAYKIPTILSTLQGIFYNAWSVSAITEFDRTDSDGFIGNIYTLYSCISVIGCSAIMVMNVFLARILYAKDFFEAWHYVPFLLLGAMFNGVALFEGCLFTAIKQTEKVLHTTLIGALINTIANVLLIQLMGPLGAAAATMLGYFSIWLIRTIQVRKIVAMRVTWGTQFLIYGILGFQTIIALYEGNELWQLICLIFIIVAQWDYLKMIVFKFMELTRRRR